MTKKRTYQAVRVEQVRLDDVLPALAAGCIVAIDVAKQKFVVALATLGGEVVKLFRFDHPVETAQFLELVTALCAALPFGVKAAMEPTGTYGDAVRHQLVSRGVPVWMVSPKRTHDSQDLFDNVRSLHDPKSAVLVAKLCAMGLASEWSPPVPTRRRLRALVELRRHEQRREETCIARIESLLARHWPELERWMDLREQKSALRLLATYPSPRRVSEQGELVMSFLRQVSRQRLSPELIAGVVGDARTTLGVPMEPEEERMVERLATEALDARTRAEEIERDMSALGREDEVFERLQRCAGTYTAAAIVALCDPRQYSRARQLEKCCGLNLREKSSGEKLGRLSITKRGPGIVRQVLYLFALRMIQESPVVRAWYVRRRGYTEESKSRAVVAVMRKLARALFHVARTGEFDAKKLFDVRRLDLDDEKIAPQKFTCRTAPRDIAGARCKARGAGAHASM